MSTEDRIVFNTKEELETWLLANTVTYKHVMTVRAALKDYLDSLPATQDVVSSVITEEAGHKSRTMTGTAHDAYTTSHWYQMYTTEYHDDPEVVNFVEMVLHNTDNSFRLLDVGCESGMTGLCLALEGRSVTFHDYNGIGLDFIRYFITKHNLTNCQVIPYGEPITPHHIVLAFDVLEHTSSHMGALRWFAELGLNIVMTYPLIDYQPPYYIYVDQYVDDAAFMTIVRQRYHVVYTEIANKRRFLVFQHKKPHNS